MDTSIIEKQPIGAVVKKADHVFSRIVRKTANNGNFYRIDWQFLNFIKERNKVAESEILDFLAFFDRQAAIRQVIDRFENDGLINAANNEITITPKGEKVFEEVFQIQETIKQKGLRGITATDYTTTIETLEKIVDNLKEYLPEEVPLTQIKEDTNSHSSKSANQSVEDLRLIKQVITSMEKAHNQKDPALLASLFAADAVFVNAAGIRLHGRKQIYTSAKTVMATFMANSYARYEIAAIRFISKEVAQVDINQLPTTMNGEVITNETNGIPTYTLLKNASAEWEIISGQNTLVLKR